MPRDCGYDWAAVRRRYEVADKSVTLDVVASEFGIPLGSVKARKARAKIRGDDWVKGGAKVASRKDAAKRVARSTDATPEATKKSKPNHDKPECGGRTHQEDKHPCHRPAGWGTDHPGTGKCKLHGGCARGKPGNRNAVTTGESLAVYLDVLTEKERQIYHSVITDKLVQLDSEIRLCEFRERWMLNRITELREAEYTKVGYTEEEETIAVDPASYKAKPVENKEEEKRAREEGLVLVKSVHQVRATYEGTLGQIQNIEDALTRIQSRKARLLDLKHKFEGEDKGNTDAVAEFLSALEDRVSEVWDDHAG